MPYDANCRLWPPSDESYFRDRIIRALQQTGPHCVSTVLAMLTGDAPETFQGKVNTQDPVSWSDALMRYGMKLAYCPTDVRKLKTLYPRAGSIRRLVYSQLLYSEQRKVSARRARRRWMVDRFVYCHPTS